MTYANGLYADFTMQTKTNAVRNNKNIVLRSLCPQGGAERPLSTGRYLHYNMLTNVSILKMAPCKPNTVKILASAIR